MAEIFEVPSDAMASQEDQIFILKNRIANKKQEIEDALASGKPQAQIESLQQTLIQYEQDFKKFQEEKSSKAMGAAA